MTLRTHVEKREVCTPLRQRWFLPVVDVPGYGAVTGIPLPSKSLAKKAALLVRKEMRQS